MFNKLKINLDKSPPPCFTIADTQACMADSLLVSNIQKSFIEYKFGKTYVIHAK